MKTPCVVRVNTGEFQKVCNLLRAHAGEIFTHGRTERFFSKLLCKRCPNRFHHLTEKNICWLTHVDFFNDMKELKIICRSWNGSGGTTKLKINNFQEIEISNMIRSDI